MEHVTYPIYNCEECPVGKVCFDSTGSYVYCDRVGQIPRKGIHGLCPLRWKLPNEDPKVWKIRELQDRKGALGDITDENRDQYYALCETQDQLIQEWLAQPGMLYMTPHEFMDIIVNRVPGNTLFILEESSCSCCRPGEPVISDSLMEVLCSREEMVRDHAIKEWAEGLVEAGMAPWREAHPEPEYCWQDNAIVDAYWAERRALEDYLWGVLLGLDPEKVDNIRYRSCRREELHIRAIYPKKWGE